MTVIAALLSVAAGRGRTGTVLVTAAVLAGQLSVGWSNDWIDARLDAQHGRRDKPIPAGEVTRRTVARAAALALTACVPLSLAAGTLAAAAHFLGLGAAFAYNAGLKRTPLSVAPYAVAFGALPAFVTLGPPPNHVPAVWALVAGGLAGAGAHFTQALPDIGRDRGSGLRGLPVVIGERGSAVTASLLLAGAALAVAVGSPSLPAVAALMVTVGLMTGAVVMALRGRPRPGFRLTLVAAGVVAASVVLGGRSF